MCVCFVYMCVCVRRGAFLETRSSAHQWPAGGDLRLHCTCGARGWEGVGGPLEPLLLELLWDAEPTPLPATRVLDASNMPPPPTPDSSTVTRHLLVAQNHSFMYFFSQDTTELMLLRPFNTSFCGDPNQKLIFIATS